MKPCIVVSREMGSEGDAVALEACELTGYRLIQTHTIGKLARRHGLQGSEWRWLDQGWYRLFARLEDRPHILPEVVRTALLEACSNRRGTLFLGRGIGELLQGHVPLVRVHVVGSFDVRVERIMRQVNIMRSRAEERVRRSDEENAWFYRYFFGLDWTDPAPYDLILDTSTGTVREAASRWGLRVRGGWCKRGAEQQMRLASVATA
jgi:cytidylate kinase